MKLHKLFLNLASASMPQGGEWVHMVLSSLRILSDRLDIPAHPDCAYYFCVMWTLSEINILIIALPSKCYLPTSYALIVEIHC